VAPRLAGNFFTVDLGATRAVFESVPWVRRALVQREFPNRLKVVLQEHKPVAFWGAEGDARLVNNFGEVFEANQGDVEAEDLPVLNGPRGRRRWCFRPTRCCRPCSMTRIRRWSSCS
jgi:cell division protein FtsQ